MSICMLTFYHTSFQAGYIWQTFLKPLEFDCWMVVGLVIVVFSLLYSLILPKNSIQPTFKIEILARTCATILFAFPTMDVDTRLTIWKRIVLFCQMIIGCLIFFHWQAVLISALTVQTIKNPFSDFDSLFASNYK